MLESALMNNRRALHVIIAEESVIIVRVETVRTIANSLTVGGRYVRIPTIKRTPDFEE
jgi:hypothetical protein